MNVYLNLDSVDVGNHVRYLYSKKNTIIDGIFTKILFANNYTTMNGLYILLPNLSVSNLCNNLYTLNPNNTALIEKLCTLEHDILKHYCAFNDITKRCDNTLSRQLYSGQIRVYRDNVIAKSNHFVIKISGVWETDQSVGLTYKINEL